MLLFSFALYPHLFHGRLPIAIGLMVTPTRETPTHSRFWHYHKTFCVQVLTEMPDFLPTSTNPAIPPLQRSVCCALDVDLHFPQPQVRSQLPQ